MGREHTTGKDSLNVLSAPSEATGGNLPLLGPELTGTWDAEEQVPSHLGALNRPHSCPQS